MIEDIKKEIEENSTIHSIAVDDNANHDLFVHIRLGILEAILDKYNNQPNYKSAWEELKETVVYDDGESSETLGEMFRDNIQELEQKHNIERIGEEDVN